MEIIWLLGIVIVVGGAFLLFSRLANTPASKKNRYSRTDMGSAGFIAIDSGGGAYISDEDGWDSEEDDSDMDSSDVMSVDNGSADNSGEDSWDSAGDSSSDY